MATTGAGVAAVLARKPICVTMLTELARLTATHFAKSKNVAKRAWTTNALAMNAPTMSIRARIRSAQPTANVIILRTMTTATMATPAPMMIAAAEKFVPANPCPRTNSRTRIACVPLMKTATWSRMAPSVMEHYTAWSSLGETKASALWRPALSCRAWTTSPAPSILATPLKVASICPWTQIATTTTSAMASKPVTPWKAASTVRLRFATTTTSAMASKPAML